VNVSTVGTETVCVIDGNNRAVMPVTRKDYLFSEI
jgi:hypothetical protein